MDAFGKDESREVRSAAIQNCHLTDQRVLSEIAIREGVEKEEQLLVGAKLGPALLSVNKLNDQKSLAEVSRRGRDPLVRRAAVEKITSPLVLSEIARTDKDKSVRWCAVNNPHFIDQIMLAEVAKKDSDSLVGKEALEKVFDQTLLAELATEDACQNCPESNS